MKNPCKKDCPDRSPTCHQTCTDYLEFFEYRRRENEQRYQWNKIHYDACHTCGKRRKK